jgi:hypothetical protein
MRLLEQAAFTLQEGAIHGQYQSRRASYRADAYTERFRSSLMALISIFLRPMVDGDARSPGAWSGNDV